MATLGARAMVGAGAMGRLRGLRWLNHYLASVGGAILDLDAAGALTEAAQPAFTPSTWTIQTGWSGTNPFSRVSAGSSTSVYGVPLTTGCRYSFDWDILSRTAGVFQPIIGSYGAAYTPQVSAVGNYVDQRTADGVQLGIAGIEPAAGTIRVNSITNLSRTGAYWRGYGALAGLSSAQGTATAMPWEATDAAGRRVLRFDGVGDYFPTDAASVLADANASYTVFTLASLSSVASTLAITSFGGTTNYSNIGVFSGKWILQRVDGLGNRYVTSTVAADTNSHVFEEVHAKETSHNLLVDGSQMCTIDAPSGAFPCNKFTIGSSRSSTINIHAPASFRGVVLIPGVPSAAIRQRIRRILGSIGGVVVS